MMKTCLIALSLILAIEGLLAWVMGLPQISAMLAGIVLVGGLGSYWKRRGSEWGWAPLVGLFALAALATFGLRNCGLIVATTSVHFVAWFFTARAIRFGAPELVPGTLDGRPGIYVVSFYSALLLAIALLRGGIFQMGLPVAVLLAFLLVMLGLAVMETGRFLGMREGAADRASRKRGIAARALALLALMGLLFLLFAKPVPSAADGLVRMALDLQGKNEDTGLDADDMPELDDVPERRPPPEGFGQGEGTPEQRSGDAPSQSRSLPVQADLQGSHVPLVYLELDNASQAAALSQRPVYVRSSTLGRYVDGEWRRVGEGEVARWLRDTDDGREDGRVTLPVEFPDLEPAAEVGYKVYVRDSNGAGLLSLVGVSEFWLPEVQRYDDDWYRARLFGNISYRAVSRPLTFDDLIGAGELQAGDPGGGDEYLDVERSRLMDQIWDLLGEMPAGRLEERLLWLRDFMAENYAYSTQIDNPDRLDPLENFLFEEKRGYCDFFATAGALIVRMMEVPSRIGYGYSKPEFDGERIFTFHADGAHSWTEIFLEGHGWVVYDLTPRQGRGVDGAAGGGSAGIAQNEAPDLSDFQDTDADPEVAGAGGGIEGGGDDAPAALESENSAVSDLVSYVVFCLALVMFGLWYFLKRDPVQEAAQGEDRLKGAGRKLPAYLAEFCQLVRAFGLEPQNGETLVEMLKALRGAGVPVDGFDAMKQYHYSTRYEDQPGDPKLEKRFLQEVRQFLKEQMRPGQAAAE